MAAEFREGPNGVPVTPKVEMILNLYPNLAKRVNAFNTGEFYKRGLALTLNETRLLDPEPVGQKIHREFSNLRHQLYRDVFNPAVHIMQLVGNRLAIF